jgi:hypothetical protein
MMMPWPVKEQMKGLQSGKVEQKNEAAGAK